MFNSFVAQTSVCALLRQSTSEMPEAKDPQELENLAVLTVITHESPVGAPALFLPLVTSHQSQITKSCRIPTYENRARNCRRIRTSKTQDLKPFRIRTYKKRWGGALVSSSLRDSANSAPLRYPFSSLFSLLSSLFTSLKYNAARKEGEPPIFDL
jgi:hypothetical protein